jgi:hypothetical protein
LCQNKNCSSAPPLTYLWRHPVRRAGDVVGGAQLVAAAAAAVAVAVLLELAQLGSDAKVGELDQALFFLLVVGVCGSS